MEIDKISQALNYLPFFSLVVDTKIPAPMVTRLVETAIMSLVAGAFAMYISVEIVKNDLNYIQESVHTLSVQVERVDKKIEKVRNDLYTPIGNHRNDRSIN